MEKLIEKITIRYVEKQYKKVKKLVSNLYLHDPLSSDIFRKATESFLKYSKAYACVKYIKVYKNGIGETQIINIEKKEPEIKFCYEDFILRDKKWIEGLYRDLGEPGQENMMAKSKVDKV